MDAHTGGPGRPADPAETAAVVEDRERYRALFRFNPHSAYYVDLEGRFLDVNPAGEQLSGYTQDELRTMTFPDLVVPQDQDLVLAAFLDVLAHRTRYIECGLRRKDGSTAELSLVATPVVVRGEVVGVHGVAEDITERSRLHRDLEHARETAEEANAVKSAFLANMSHELRTPLTSILGMAEVLSDTDLDTRQRKFVDAIERAGGRLHRLVDDVLEFAQVEAGTVEIREGEVDLRQVVGDTVAWAQPLAAAKGLDLDWRVDDQPVALRGDALRISQVLDRLVDNAVKFTVEGTVEVAAEVASVRPGEATVALTVRDTGIGIPDAALDTVLEPFVQVDSSMTRHHEGAGLGLATCRHFVDRMGGSLSFDSQDGRGSEFRVVLPLAARTPE